MDEKHNWLGKFWENFENLQKIPEENCKNCCIFAYFAKKFQKHAFNFRAFGRKTIGWGNFEKILKIFDENSIEKLNFYLFLGKFVAKYRNFGNNIIFLQQFFPVRGGFEPPNPPCLRHWLQIIFNFKSKVSPRVIFSRSWFKPIFLYKTSLSLINFSLNKSQIIDESIPTKCNVVKVHVVAPL